MKIDWNRVYEFNFEGKRTIGGIQLYPYQLAFGLSLRFLSCINSFMFRLYLGPIKLWISLEINKS